MRSSLSSFINSENYKLKYSNIPIFDSDLKYSSIKRPWYNELLPIDISMNKSFKYFFDRLHFTTLGKISFKHTPEPDMALYLKVNKKTPGLVEIDTKGTKDHPLEFSWFIRGNNYVDKRFRYRLLPDKSWSSWSRFNKKFYSFISRGNHVFEVEAKYLKQEKWYLTPTVKYKFNLAEPYIALPNEALVKADSEKFDTYSLNTEEISTLYDKKYALIFGVKSYKDFKFSPLPFVENDTELMENSLKRYNFLVSKYVGSLSENEISNLIVKNIQLLKNNDFLVIYISSHGFNNYAAGYIATSNCEQATAKNCLSLNFLDKVINTNNHKGKHVLVLLDSCSSGLGVINKDSSFPERDMVFKSGAIMITAGLENQSAQMIKNIKSSVFTHFFAKGLDGEADIIKDNVITTSELLLYVRYKVAKYTEGMQIPMMGRISGSGEMVFSK